MKYLRIQLMTALLCLVAMVQAQTNVLRVDTVKAPAGKTVTIPIVMENQSDVTGVQFELYVPYELAVDDESGAAIVSLSKTRANGHTVVTRKLSSNYSHYYSPLGRYAYRYRIIVYSDENALFLDDEGTLLTVQLTTDADLADATELPVYLGDVTLSDPQMNNVVTATANAPIIIQEIPRPDFEPYNVTFTQTETGPGQTLDVAWMVKNVGKADAEGGWSEAIVLVAGSSSTELATIHYDGTLAAGAEVSRSAQLTLPAILGLDGAAQVEVVVIPDGTAGEHATMRDNNTARSANNIRVNKKLTLEITPARISETNTWQRISVKLIRSGKWSELESFRVTTYDSEGNTSTESRVSLPQLMMIQPGEASAIYYMNITNNDVLDADTLVRFKIEDTREVGKYAPVEGTLVIVDDELPKLTLTASKTSITEGIDQTFRLTVKAERAPDKNLAVTITSENVKRFKTFPATLVIPAGETTAQMTVTVVDDNESNGRQTVKFTASAPDHKKGETLVEILDDDLPELTLTLTPTQVQESDGPVSVTGILKRTSNINKKVTIKLTDDADGGLYFGNRTLEMPRGTEEIRFNFGPKDNQDVDGDRTYNVTAAVWLSSCSCSAVGEAAGHVSAQLTVLDDDGLALRLTSANGTVKEGGTTTLTVTRNTNDTSAPVTVTIASDFDEELEYNHTVTIPSGQKSIDVQVKSKLNDVNGDSHTVIFTVTSDGWASGTCWVMVTDQTLPDAAIKAIAACPAEVLVGQAVTLTLDIANEGNTATLPAATQVKVYEQGNKEAIATFTIDDDLAVGDTRTLEKSVTPTKSVGTHRLYAVINENNTVQELSPNNNTSATVEVQVNSPFMATLATDRERYNQNDVVVFTGQLTGQDYSDAEVDLYIVCDGTRQEQRVRADAQGAFTYKWELGNALSGHAIAGVCYPGAGAKAEITAFDIYGLRRYDTSYIKHQLTVGKQEAAAIQLVNPGVLPLTGVKVEVVEKPDNYDIETTIPETIDGGVSDALLTYRLTGTAQSTGNNWEQVKLLVTSNEGIELPITLYCYARMAQASLVTPNQRITTTMTIGQVREYPVQLINKGQGNTGKISLALPDWITCAQGSTLAGINVGDTATVVLRMKPTSDMQLNVPVTGTIGFNVEYGNGTYANFSVTPVSDKTGTLRVVVNDEYTYYTDEKPHVKDAEVVLRNSVTNAIVTIDGQPAQGRSDENGEVIFENLPEGYYKLSVTADNHDSYANNIIVDPGVTTTKVVNLSVETIKVSWTVEETEVEDVYEIVTTVTYETNVPAPVVDLIVPSRIPADSLAEGESLVFYAIATNKGLINAEECEIWMPERTGIYLWEPLAENTGLTIAPQQSYILPIKVTRLTPNDSRMHRAGSSSSGCVDKVGVDYSWQCGMDRKWHQVPKPITYKDCPKKELGAGAGYGGIGGGLGNPSGGFGGGYGWNSGGEKVTITNECDPCAMSLLNSVVNCVIGFTPAGCAVSLGQCVVNFIDQPDALLSNLFDCAVGIGGCVANMTWGKILAAVSCLKNLGQTAATCVEEVTSNGGARRKAPAMILETDITTIAYLNELLRAAYLTEKQWNAACDMVVEIMGDEQWLEASGSEMEKLLDAAIETPDAKLVADSLRKYKPEAITNEVFDRFVERMLNTRVYDRDGTEPANNNRIHIDGITKAKAEMDEAEQWVRDNRKQYLSVEEYWNSSYQTTLDKMKEPRNSVCSTITLQIKQTMTMTRQAFRGTLTVFNGNESNAMTDMKLNLVVSDMYNNVATSHEFQINAESLKGFQGPLALDGGWSLAPNSEGTATILFIPTKYAAPTEPVEWSFGGTLSYTDPNSGLEVTRELYPVTLTVKPLPELDLTYFMQRDVYGDDPLTPDIIEPMEDAEFALLINNKGYGDATKVKMVTEQPEIVENEKGLAIDFELVSSQVNGGPAALSFGQTIANDLGDIPAGTQAYAQWWLQSTLLGHFTSYKVEATHVTSYGNEDLSLLDQVTIHELIHGFTPPRLRVEGSEFRDFTADGRAFLVNDIEDADDLPDQLYFTDATQADVSIAAAATATKQTATEYLLTVAPPKAGWTYGSLLDPTAGKQKLEKVVRKSDGLELPLDNVWQTSRSLRDGQEWLYENRLHFIAEMPAAGETFILTYEKRPDVELDFTLSEPVYEEDNAAEHLVIADVDNVTVTFNKPIDAATFDTDDVTLQVQGERRDISQMTITPKDGEPNAYLLSLSEVNKTLPNGYYVLSVQGSGITDGDGYNGLFGRKIDWVLFRGGLIDFRSKPYPAGSGTISMELLPDPSVSHPSPSSVSHPCPIRVHSVANNNTPSVAYGAHFRLTATAAEGYEFDCWTLNGEAVSTDPVLETNATGDMDFVANFKKKEYMVDITAGDNGSVAGSGAGYYEYDTDIAIVAKPSADFRLKGWTVDGEAVTTDTDTLRLTVKQAMTIKAEFVRDIYTQTIAFTKGWQWVSSYMLESLPFGNVVQYADRIMSQTDELVRDPVYGMVGGLTAFEAGQAYKVSTPTRFQRTLRGHLHDSTVELKKGWNWMAFPYYEECALDIIANAEDGDFITSLTGGFAEYSGGTWQPALPLTPGEGYLYKSVSDKAITFTPGEAAPARSTTAVANSTLYTLHSTLTTRFPSILCVTARLCSGGIELAGPEYTIYAFAGEELRGVSRFEGGSYYLTVYGDNPAEITFMVENSETGEAFAVEQKLTFRSDVVGSRKSPFTFTIGTATALVAPWSDNARQGEIYDLQGRRLNVQRSTFNVQHSTFNVQHSTFNVPLKKGVYIVNGRKRFVK